MNFEYNGNLLEDERINLVAKEIINAYPDITLSKAKEAAMLEGKISEKVTSKDKLDRLYNIMLVTSENKNIVSKIYPDFLKLLKETQTEDLEFYLKIAKVINDFLEKKSEFPYVSDFE